MLNIHSNLKKNAREIVYYLQKKFTEKEVNSFYKALNDFEK